MMELTLPLTKRKRKLLRSAIYYFSLDLLTPAVTPRIKKSK